MSGLLLVFVASIASMFVSIYLYNKKEESVYSDLLRQLQASKSELKAATDLFSGHRTMLLNQSLKIKELDESFAKIKTDFDQVQEHCAKTREQQIDLKNSLSNKRPVIRIEQPISVQVVDDKKIKSKKEVVK